VGGFPFGDDNENESRAIGRRGLGLHWELVERDSAIGLWQVRVQFDGACASVKVEDNGENRRIDCVALRFVILSCTAATLPCVETNCARCLGVGGCRARHVTRRFGARRVEAW
jgi:hypothetical protein